METLKVLADIAKDLPQTALWVILGFFIYKTVIIGSIYGVLRLAIIKLHDVLTTFAKRGPPLKVTQVKELDDVKVFEDAVTPLTDLLSSVRTPGLMFLHKSDVRELAKAWNLYQQQRGEPETTETVRKA